MLFSKKWRLEERTTEVWYCVAESDTQKHTDSQIIM